MAWRLEMSAVCLSQPELKEQVNERTNGSCMEDIQLLLSKKTTKITRVDDTGVSQTWLYISVLSNWANSIQSQIEVELDLYSLSICNLFSLFCNNKMNYEYILHTKNKQRCIIILYFAKDVSCVQMNNRKLTLVIRVSFAHKHTY